MGRCGGGRHALYGSGSGMRGARTLTFVSTVRCSLQYKYHPNRPPVRPTRRAAAMARTKASAKKTVVQAGKSPKGLKPAGGKKQPGETGNHVKRLLHIRKSIEQKFLAGAGPRLSNRILNIGHHMAGGILTRGPGPHRESSPLQNPQRCR
eukprot:gene2194-biopygen7387